MTVTRQSPVLSAEDGQLVDLVRAALVDPNLHDERRMRLHRDITELLRAAHQHALDSSIAAHEHDVSEVLESVLVDPTLHTDVRMRLHREIAELLRTAR
jgi:hypothetical protein